MDPTEATILSYRGAEIAAILEPLAALRIAVFAEWPYLYAGDADYEARYLERYATCPRAVVFAAQLDGDLIGATTAIPLADEDAAFRKPIAAAGIDPAGVCYFGESVVLPEHRGHGLGARFFDLREAYARSLPGITRAAFCAVDRDPDDPRRPAGARSPESLWHRRGYARQDALRCRYAWPEIGQTGSDDEDHDLTFWLRALT